MPRSTPLHKRFPDSITFRLKLWTKTSVIETEGPIEPHAGVLLLALTCTQTTKKQRQQMAALIDELGFTKTLEEALAAKKSTPTT